MGELSVRRNRGMTVPRYQGTGKAEKQAGAAKTQQPANRAAATVSETLRQLMTRVSQVERHVREGRRTLQSGEAALAEVADNLDKMEELAREAAGDGVVDRAALQKSLELLRGEVDRIAKDGAKAGLFQEGEAEDGPDVVVDAVMDGLSARQDGVEDLPAWLLRGMAGGALDKTELLNILGLDSSASGREVLAALGGLPLEDSAAAGYLAALYLGAVIAGGVPSGAVDPEMAAEGLRLLLEAVAGGASPDAALELLTGGAFTGLADFQAQFTGGTAPGLEFFLMDLLLSGEGGDGFSALLALMGGGGDMAMLMDLLASMSGSGDGLMALLDGVGASETPAFQQEAQEAPEAGMALPMEARELGTVQAAGRDLSGTAFDPEANELTVSGVEDMVLRGVGPEQEAPAVRLTGSGAVTLQQMNVPLLSVESAQARVLSAGESVLAQLHLGEGAELTLEGGGLLRIAELWGGASSVLRLAGGAVALSGEDLESLAAAVVMDGPASLLAAEGVSVQNPQGQPLTPFDIVWKALLPEWSLITSLVVDGRQGQLILREDDLQDPVRLWLLKGDDSKGYPAHTVVFRGRDRAGHPRVRYLYVRWDERRESFQEISMYPNPFTVTGGEPDEDWCYVEEIQTLRILSGQVTSVSGGAGTDANQISFSGRIALDDGVGVVKLTLDGVECRVSSGRAFSLGRGNDVTLLLRRGTDNVFESGPGCAGISLGDGTALRIDQAKGEREKPEGTLTATGGLGGAGIGRDKGAGQERTGPIHICGGVVTATGTGGGAGIGGALGAPVGDIRIQGGMVAAEAACCAAAIGAGIQGACGDVVITGSAHIVRAQGGGPDGDIGGCLFGNCGKVQVSTGTDIGDAKLWSKQGLSLQMGESSVTLPKFRVSTRALHLDGLDLSTREAARAAMEVLVADHRWVTRLQGAYGAMYGQLAQNLGGMYSVHRYFSVVRDTNEASALLVDMREVLRQSPLANFLRQRGMEDVGQLLR